MALKMATEITFTKINGEQVIRIARIKKVIFHYDEMRVETIYEMFPSAEAQERGGIAELCSQSVSVDLTNPADVNLILAASDTLWAKNFTQPFILDYTELNENGKMIPIMRSMEELGAVLVDV